MVHSPLRPRSISRVTRRELRSGNGQSDGLLVVGVFGVVGPVGSGSGTVTVKAWGWSALPAEPVAVTVMVAVPGPTAVTVRVSASLSTVAVATDGLLDVRIVRVASSSRDGIS